MTPFAMFLRGDVLDQLRLLPDESVQCIVTSPPYFGLRDYGVAGQFGLEPTPEAYVASMVAVFRELRRVLRKDGTLWLNLGDSYARNPAKGQHKPGDIGKQAYIYDSGNGRASVTAQTGLADKQLIGIPWRVAFALQADGWYLRQDIIWHKPNPLPESVKDRCTKSHEYLFLLTKSDRYYFDHMAIQEPVAESTKSRLAQNVEAQAGSTRVPGKTNGNMKAVGNSQTRSARSVWKITTKPYKGAHFATFPEDLPARCIKAGTPAQGVCAECGAPHVLQSARECDACGAARPTRSKKCPACGDIRKAMEPRLTFTTGYAPACACGAGTVPAVVLDPFGGGGTTALAALRLGRSSIYIDLNPDYRTLAIERIDKENLLP